MEILRTRGRWEVQARGLMCEGAKWPATCHSTRQSPSAQRRKILCAAELHVKDSPRGHEVAAEALAMGNRSTSWLDHFMVVENRHALQ